jgi:beta-carotene ketolase (CrtW type)
MQSTHIDDHRGTAIACTIVVAWVLVTLVAMWSARTSSLPVSLALVALVVRTFLNVGLFIVAHDAMHGSISRHRAINDGLGRLALLLFGGLPFLTMRTAHHQHHAVPARSADPDYCHDERFVPWLWSFLRQYVTGRLLWHNFAVVVFWWVVVDVPLVAVFGLWVLPSWLATVQLFAFGTYLPHRRHDDTSNPHRARSMAAPAWVTFLCCYHFGYHHEHHTSPQTPWWGLPALRKRRTSVA